MVLARIGPVGVVMALACASAIAQNCTLNETQKLAPEVPQSNAKFGWSVAIAGDVLVVGQPERDVDTPFSQAGVAEVWERIGGTWTRSQVLQSDTPGQSERFGESVATDGQVVVVGSSREEVNGQSQAGAVFVFEKIGGVWSQTDQLISTDVRVGNEFGFALSLDDTKLVVGEPRARVGTTFNRNGAVHVFDRAGNTFSHSIMLQPTTSAIQPRIGESVATDGPFIVAGAPTSSGISAGEAFVFGDDNGWLLLETLQAPSPINGSEFGTSVAIRDGTIAVGAVRHSLVLAEGSVFVFEPSGPGDWAFAQQFSGSTSAQDDDFGKAIAFHDADTMIVTAPNDDDGGSSTGSAFVFTRDGGTWAQQGGAFGNADRAAGDSFGWSIASDGERLLIPALTNDDGGLNAGTVHVFELNCDAPCPGDIADDFGTLGGDGMVSFGDFLALLGLVRPCPGGTPGCDGDIADDFGTPGGDGMVSFGDFLALLGLVGPCP